MNTVALITPTYSHDLERCTLLCESVDRHVGAFANHYLIVPDDELALFAKFNKSRRQVLPLSLSYDHRLIDGADAARFLRWVAEAFEQPFLLSVQG